jgi:hypothetical protein
MPKTKRDTLPPALAVLRDTYSKIPRPQVPQESQLDCTIDSSAADETLGSCLARLKMARRHQGAVVKDYSVDPAQGTKKATVSKSWIAPIALVDAKTREVIGRPMFHTSLNPETSMIVDFSMSIDKL